jgi:hypothetical protein
MDKIAARLKSIGTGTMLAGGAISAAGSAALIPMLAAAKSFSDYVDNLGDATVKTGFTVEALSQLGFVAEQQGTSIEVLQTGLVGMAKFTTAVASGGKGAVKVLDALGISSKEFLAMGPEERFRVLAEQISRIQDPTLRAGMAMKVFGRSAADMMPMLALGSEGMAEMQKKAEALGLTVSTEMTQKFGSFSDELAAIGQQGKRIWWGFGMAMIEAITPFIPVIQSAMRAVIDFVDSNRGLIVMGIAAAMALLFLGGVITSVGMVLWGMGAIVSAVSTLVSIGWTLMAAAANLGAISTSFFAGALAIWNAVCSVTAGLLAALLSPIGLIVLGIAAVIAVIGAAVVIFATCTEAGRAMVDSLVANFLSLFAIVKQVFGGIFDALMAGDWGLAAQSAFAGIALAWEIMVGGLKSAWWGFVSFMGSILLTGLQFVDGLIRGILNKLIDAYNWAAEKMGLSTVAAVNQGTAAFAVMQAGLNAGLDAKRGAIAGDILKAKGNLDSLTAKAAAARKAREDAFKIKVPGIPGFAMPDLSKLGATGGKDGPATGTLGTFNAAVAGMFNQSVPDAMEKVAENTERSNELLEEVRDKIGEGGLEWGN